MQVFPNCTSQILYIATGQNLQSITFPCILSLWLMIDFV